MTTAKRVRHVGAGSRRCIALLALFVSLACSGRDDSRAEPAARRDPEAAFRARLGQEWTLVRLGTHEIPPSPPGTRRSTPSDPVPGARPTIRFTEDASGAGGRTFCNAYGGPYELRGDSLRIGQIEMTMVGCDGPDSLETRYLRALQRTRRFEIDSTTLILLAEDGTRLTFMIGTAADSAAR